MAEESVKVAVRVRPFNKREKARNAKLIVQMNGNSTSLTNPEDPNEEPKKFAFDFSYWSFDGFKANDDGYLAVDKPNYCDQRRVYDDLGVGVLKNAWEGYNTSLFAYGQTGSGKSWSIVGYPPNRGIVPIFCEEIFKGIDAKKAEGVEAQYEVTFSMLEIYNEQVRDLLNPKSNKKGGLKVRQHPKKGFYVESLLFVPVSSYIEIEGRMDEGTTNRTVASTNMNATSSRAHTIVNVKFTQKSKNAAGEETAKTSIINLVDLAGSERADSTGATGDRLKEGAAINQSLSSLGNCIAALAEKSSGKKVRVPFRDSVLTKLLKNALGGNSKTIMIAAISPADINYEETLSTLRYADRAKQIKTVATVNEDPTEKLIRELKEENERLMELLKKSENGEAISLKKDDDDDDEEEEGQKEGMSEEEIAAMRKQIEEELKAEMAQMEKEMKDMNQNWEEKVAENSQPAVDKEAKKKEQMEKCHLWNLNPDPMLSGMIVHIVKPGNTTVGRRGDDMPDDISLAGLNILAEHAVIVNESDNVKVKPFPGARVLVNGEPITNDQVELHHNDRVMFGSSHLYVFYNPTELKKLKDAGEKIDEDITYEEAQEEIAMNAGFEMSKEDVPEHLKILQEDVADLTPMVEEANAISQELDKKVSFELTVISAKARGEQGDGRPMPFIIMKDLMTGLEWLWPRQKFVNRKYRMQEMYENFFVGEEWDLPEDSDPFKEDKETEVLVGCVEVSVACLGYMLDLKEQLQVTDYKGNEIGNLNICIAPLNSSGQEITEDDDVFIDDPSQLDGKKLDYYIDIESAVGLPRKYYDLYCCYEFFTNQGRSDTVASPTNAEFNFKTSYSQNPCNSAFLECLQNVPLVIKIMAKQKPDKPINRAALSGQNTKSIMMAETMRKGMGKGSGDGHQSKQTDMKILTQAAILQRRNKMIEAKLDKIRKLCNEQEQNGHIAVKIEDVMKIAGQSDIENIGARNQSSACTIL